MRQNKVKTAIKTILRKIRIKLKIFADTGNKQKGETETRRGFANHGFRREHTKDKSINVHRKKQSKSQVFNEYKTTAKRCIGVLKLKSNVKFLVEGQVKVWIFLQKD